MTTTSFCINNQRQKPPPINLYSQRSQLIHNYNVRCVEQLLIFPDEEMRKQHEWPDFEARPKYFLTAQKKEGHACG